MPPIKLPFPGCIGLLHSIECKHKGLLSPHPELGFGALPNPPSVSLLPPTSGHPAGGCCGIFPQALLCLAHVGKKDPKSVSIYTSPPPDGVHLLRRAAVLQSVAGYGSSQICVFNVLSRKHFWLGVLEGGVKPTECQAPGGLLMAAGWGVGANVRIGRMVTLASGWLSVASALWFQGKVALGRPYWIWVFAGGRENITSLEHKQ